MDGTLLDLSFDNFFWLEAVPAQYAARRGLTLEQAKEILTSTLAAKRGTLDWYCTDYWSRELGLDIVAMKEAVGERVRFLPGAQAFLRSLQASGIRTVLVTNAHQDVLRIKAARTGLLDYLNEALSSHQFGAPKEQPAFWSRLETELGIDRKRALFVDDSIAVLQAARDFGIGHIVAIAHPDTTQERRVVEEFASVHAVVELLSLSNAPRMIQR